MQLFLMACAGALGTLARYGVTLLLQQFALQRLQGFPLGTLAANVAGSFLLGLLTAVGARWIPDVQLRLILGTGFLGAFTTFSTFELEAQRLVAERNWSHLGLYVSGNLLLGYAAVVLGVLLAMRLS